ncbi:MAG: lactam utilization protein LamB [Anaerolineaceae bacterium]|nr:lactam utilization protein LamB [Anaerolineaceae bacterium]
MQVDLNCDMGEGYGRYQIGNDAELISLVTSANIACGFHAGDPLVMQNTIRLAVKNQVAVGAHPGYADLQGFGRRVLDLTAEEIEVMITYQIGALAAVAKANQTEMVHVKPHGALYNQAAANRTIAKAIATAVSNFSKNLILVGLAGSCLVEAGMEAGLRVAQEGFPERGYNPDGSLISRSQPGALIHDPQAAAEQALRLVRDGIRAEINGSSGSFSVDTLCIHGDSPGAVLITSRIRQVLQEAGVQIRSGITPKPRFLR